MSQATPPQTPPAAPPAKPKLTFWQKVKGGELRRLTPRLRPHAGALGIATVMLLAGTAASLVFPAVVGRILDAAAVSPDARLLNRTALFLFALFALQAVLTFGQTYLLSAVGERVIAGIRRDLFGHLLTLPPAFFADRRTGELTSRLTADVGMMQAVLSTYVSELFRLALTLAGTIVMLVLTQAQLALLTLAVVPIVVGTGAYFGKLLRKSSLGVMDQVAEATAIAEEAFAQIRVVQSFVGEEHERGRYGQRMDHAVAVALKRAVTRGLFSSVIGFATFSASVLVLWVGGKMVLAGELTAGTLVSFLLYAGYAASSVGGIGQLWSAYQEATGAAGRVFEILNARPRLRDPDRPVPLPQPVRGEVAFEEVWFRYERPAELPTLPPPGNPMMWWLPPKEDAAPPPLETPPDWTLRGVSFRIAPGETVALVGPSGAGKTTIAGLIPRFWDAQGGRVALDGVDIRELRLAELRAAVGLVPQETLLFSGSVRENIAYGRPEASDAEVEAAARAAHAHEFVQLLPDGYDTRVGERGVKLSGGQRQRVALARAILKDPTVLILDEATSSLDAESEALIEDALNHLLKGRTTLIIAHRLSTVRRANRLLVLDRGEVVEEGTHAELLARGGLYARLYARQFRDEPADAEAAEAETPSEAVREELAMEGLV
ncbi:MAG TPA: ABC transporter transmembrane domain-containing protein [Longimicrobium sp.]|jgi:subfamily B ATP-binding cassette protein MsbA